jgi:hypothetical protein
MNIPCFVVIIFYLDPLLHCEDVHDVLSGEVTRIDNILTCLHPALESVLVLSYHQCSHTNSHPTFQLCLSYSLNILPGVSLWSVYRSIC